ncbi:MAG: AAA family ATPase [Gammaproteobacteria bacterium]
MVHAMGEIIFGKEQEVRLALACLLARGHLLIEDLPGVGKTTLAQVLARVMGLEYQRVQFTSDLLPADVTGISIFNQETRGFEFHPGPLFSQLVLADEVNRATPKAQSALLEAMEEYQVTVDGQTHALPEPFFVIATQNPFHQIGTFPLPESQLDRFLIRIHLGYPDKQAERELLSGRDRRDVLKEMQPSMRPEQLLAMQKQVNDVQVAGPILDYIQSLLLHSRNSPQFSLGLSPRAGLALIQAAKAWAYMMGRDMVVPDDVQAVLHGVVAHRLRTTAEADEDDMSDAAAKLLRGVPVLAA